MREENKANIPDDEIDLKSLGSKIYAGIVYPVSLLFSNILITLCFIFAAVILSVVFKYVVPKTYTSSFILRPTDVKDKIYPKILADIPVLLKKGDKHALKQILELDSILVDELVQINITHALVKNFADSINTTEIEIETRNTQAMIPVQNSILHYLENNSYYLRIKNLQKDQIDMSLEQVDKDLAQLDSLKRLQLNLYANQKATLQNSIVLNELINPVAAYNVSADRMAKKTSLLAQSVFLDRFFLLKSCVIPSHHDWPPRILILCLFAVPFSLLLCVLFLHHKTKRS